ncbi:ribokinase [Acidiphilium sp.]|uniref:ribokinase n=1 Tax=Acidiphilium sp. TaxID=527 RepID=UPI003CFD1A16
MIVIGSINMDIVAHAERAPGPGETVFGRDYAFYPGGKGANQAVAARRAGADVTFFGCLGNDTYGDTLNEALSAEGIDPSGITRVPTPTGIAFITVDASGENRIIVIPGANYALRSADLPSVFEPGTVLLTQLEIPIPIVIAAASSNRASGGTTILNISPIAGLDAATLIALRDVADILLINETEAAGLLALEQLGSPEAAALDLALGHRAAIITLGADGVVWAAATSSGPSTGRLPRHNIEVIDTTGCGDAFAGAFSAAIERGESISAAVAYGNAAGGLAATKSGAQAAMPTAQEIDDILNA